MNFRGNLILYTQLMEPIIDIYCIFYFIYKNFFLFLYKNIVIQHKKSSRLQTLRVLHQVTSASVCKVLCQTLPHRKNTIDFNDGLHGQYNTITLLKPFRIPTIC